MGVCCSRGWAVLLKLLCSKLVVKEKKKKFYYPPNSCCVVLRGSFSKEVWLAEQRHKAQVLAGSRLLTPPGSALPGPHPLPSARLGAERRGPCWGMSWGSALVAL